MQRSSIKPLHSLKLASAGLAPALALIVLGASAPRLAAQQSDDFNSQSIANWSRYTYPVTNPYGVAQYSFPTNPASANNYAVRIVVPPIIKDTNTPPALLCRGGIIWTNGDAMYGPTDPSNPGFNASVDLIAWNTAWSDSVCGLGWFVQGASFQATSAYFSGWGPGLATIGITRLDLSANPPYAILGQVTEKSTVLNTNHQYRISASSYDGATFLVSVFDRSQTNTAWQSAISQDYTLYTSGYCALMVANTGIPAPWESPGNSTQGGDATFDNYSAYRPISGQEPATSPARVSDTSPTPAGVAAEYYPTVSASILNLETAYRPGTIQLYMDGTLITSGATVTTGVVKPDPNGGTITWPGVTITYPISVLYPSGSLHTNTVVFQTDQEISANPGHYYTYTNSWSWTLKYAPRYATSGSLSVKGFDARLVMSYNVNDTTYANIGQTFVIGGVTNTGIGNSVASAQAVLNYQYPVNFAATNIVPLVNFDRSAESFGGNPSTNFPGMCLPAADPAYVNSYAVQVLSYLQLPAGTNHFWLDSDDGAAVYTGVNLTDTSVVLFTGDGVNHKAFDWYVPQDGLYPVNIVFEEGGGGSYLFLSTTNATAGTSTLVNDPSSTVQAFYPLACLSSTSVKGTYALDAAANAGNVLTTSSSLCENGTGSITNLTVTGGTITMPLPTAPKYYRLDSPRATKITSVAKSGSNLVIKYQTY